MVSPRLVWLADLDVYVFMADEGLTVHSMESGLPRALGVGEHAWSNMHVEPSPLIVKGMVGTDDMEHPSNDFGIRN